MGEETCCPACGYGVDYEPFIAAGPSETEIRVVPESAVAEAVAAERERCAQAAEIFATRCEGTITGRAFHEFAALLRNWT